MSDLSVMVVGCGDVGVQMAGRLMDGELERDEGPRVLH